MQDDSAVKDGAAVKSSISDWRLSQVFGGDKAPEEEIPEGLQFFFFFFFFFPGFFSFFVLFFCLFVLFPC